MKSFRLSSMEQYIIEKKHVTMDELCEKFNVSINTVRLDVAQLVQRGSVRKVYGGVAGVKKNQLIPFEQRKVLNADVKENVCRAAAELIEDGDVIFVDSGSTLVYLLDNISEEINNVTVITHNLNAIVRAVPNPNISLIALPGNLDRKTNSFVNGDTEKFISRYNINKAFIACAGISEKGDIFNSSPLEYEIKKAAMANSVKKYLVVDSTKYGRLSLLTFAHLEDFDMLITDEGMDGNLASLCKEKHVGIRYPKN